MSIATVSKGSTGDYEDLTVSSTAVGFTTAKIKVVGPVGTVKSGEAFFGVETAPIRFTTNGTTPTATVGVLVNPGQFITITSEEDVERFRAIRTAADASLKCLYKA